MKGPRDAVAAHNWLHMRSLFGCSTDSFDPDLSHVKVFVSLYRDMRQLLQRQEGGERERPRSQCCS